MKAKWIDRGQPFDWGKTSEDYARFRDIYPPAFYSKILDRHLGIQGQRALDVGTGTGVLPRHLYRFGAKWTGIDSSPNQIEQARLLSRQMNIDYHVVSVEDASFPDACFDVITACQCFCYFDHQRAMPNLHRMLKRDGSLLVLYMAWLPAEDAIAGASETLALQYNPAWSGAGETMHPIAIPACYQEGFRLAYQEEYQFTVPFTRDSWHGRMKTCRGIGASLPPEKLAMWECEHRQLLQCIAPERFDILHYAAVAELKKR